MPKYGWIILLSVIAVMTYFIMQRKKVGITQISLDDYMQTVFGKPRS